MIFVFNDTASLKTALRECEQLTAIDVREASCPADAVDAVARRLNEVEIDYLGEEREFPRIHQLIDRWGQGLLEAQERIDSGNAGLPSTGWGRWDTAVIETAPNQFAFVNPEFSELAGFDIAANADCEMSLSHIEEWVANSEQVMAHHAAQMVFMRRINEQCEENK